MLADARMVFLKEFLHHPQTIGSITPSSNYLVQRMLSHVPWNQVDTVVELGAGTGVFTQAIANQLQSHQHALIIEQDDTMLNHLQCRFPDMYYGHHAEDLQKLLEQYGMQKADCIISSLPYAVFPVKLRLKILHSIYRSLTPNGIFMAYQYSPQMYRTFRRIFSHIELSFEWRNLPPAIIYQCKK